MRLALALIASLTAALPAGAENRAVVIGNSDYLNAPDLAGADLRPVVEALGAARFRIGEATDLGSDDLRRYLGALTIPDPQPTARIVVLNGRFLHGSGETWFMGTNAQEPGLFGAGVQGVPLSVIMRLISDGRPGAVLMLGTDAQKMPVKAGLESGIGGLVPPQGVAVITGTPEAITRAAAELMRGVSVSRAVAVDQALQLVAGSPGDLVLLPQDMPPQTGEDPLRADRDAWAGAAAADSPEAYDRYLESYPRGIYSAAARERLARLKSAPDTSDSDREAWAAAAAADTVAAYMSYLGRFPSGQYAAAARARLEDGRVSPTPPQTRPGMPPSPPGAEAEREMAMNSTERATIQRWLTRLGHDTGTPDGVFGQRTRSAIAAWQRANDLPATGYLTPAERRMILQQTSYLDGDNGSRDRAYWQETGARGDAAGLRAYLRRYPNGLQARTAQRMLDEATGSVTPDLPQGDQATWRWAREQGSAAAYETYLDRYPRGQYAGDARDHLQTMRATTEAARREEDNLRLDASTRRLVEERLRIAGMRPGTVDGEFTDQTRAALRRYQGARNLRVTGFVTQETVTSLLADVLLR